MPSFGVFLDLPDPGTGLAQLLERPWDHQQGSHRACSVWWESSWEKEGSVGAVGPSHDLQDGELPKEQAP